MALHSEGLDISDWELVLPTVMHSLRTLLCTSTNETPHERMMKFRRRSSLGCSLPSWILDKGKVLVKRHVKQSKYDPSCDEAEIVSVNPTHARVRFANGREGPVSLKHLAPMPQSNNPDLQTVFPTESEHSGSTVECCEDVQGVTGGDVGEMGIDCDEVVESSGNDCKGDANELRRSSRVNKGVAPDRYKAEF